MCRVLLAYITAKDTDLVMDSMSDRIQPHVLLCQDQVGL